MKTSSRAALLMLALIGALNCSSHAAPAAKVGAKKPASQPKSAADLADEEFEESDKLNRAIDAGDLALVKKIVEGGPKSVLTRHYFPPLHQTTNKDRAEIAAYLLSRGVKWDTFIEGSTTGGKTALHYAVMNKAYKVAAVLLLKGADINATQKTDITPLHTAVMEGDLKFAKWLLDKGADPNSRTYSNRTPLFYAAAMEGDKGIPLANLLVSRRASLEAVSGDGRTALLDAAEQGSPAMVAWLLGKGAKTDAANREGHTALSLALALRAFENAKTLLKGGANVSIKDAEGALPFDTVLNLALDAEANDRTALYELCEMMFALKAPRARTTDLAEFATYAQKRNLPTLVAIVAKGSGDRVLIDNFTLISAKIADEAGTLGWKQAFDAATVLSRKGDAASKTQALSYLGKAADKLPATGFDAEAEAIYTQLLSDPELEATRRTALAEGFLQRAPQSTSARALRARARSDAGDFLRSIDDWNGLLKTDAAPELKAEWLFQRGYAFLKFEKWPLAIADFDAAEKGGVTKADLWSNRGYAKSKIDDLAGALAEYEIAIGKDKLYFEAHLNKANALLAQGKSDDALAQYTMITDSLLDVPGTSRAQKSLAYGKKGEILVRLKRKDEAERAFTASIGWQPMATTLVNRADIYNFSRRSDLALQDAEAAIALDPQAGAPYYEKALALFLLGRRDDALIAANKGIEVAPDEAQLFFFRANIYEAKGMSVEAKRDMDKARALGIQ